MAEGLPHSVLYGVTQQEYPVLSLAGSTNQPERTLSEAAGRPCVQGWMCTIKPPRTNSIKPGATETHAPANPGRGTE